jgi:hypothetical protein
MDYIASDSNKCPGVGRLKRRYTHRTASEWPQASDNDTMSIIAVTNGEIVPHDR